MAQQLTFRHDVAIGMAAVFVVMAFFGWSFLRLERESSDLRDIELQFETSAQELLATIGFDGMIHDFKNCVLRPGEPRYCDEARDNADQALVLMDQLEAQALQAGIVLDVNEVRNAVMTYRRAADRVRAEHEAGRSIAEIDSTVRYDDAPAAGQIRTTLDLTRKAMAERLANLIHTLRLQSFAGLGALLLLLVGFGLVIRNAFRQSVQREQRLSAVFAAVSGGLIGIDAQGRIALANPTARDMLFLGDRFPPLDWRPELELHWPDRSSGPMSGQTLFDRVLAGRQLHGEVLRLHDTRTKGRDIFVRIASAPVDIRSGGISAILLIDDVTGTERSRQQIERNSRLDALGQLTGGMAHDFNNLLATILYAIELAQRSTDRTAANAMLDRAKASVMRGRELTSRLLTFARRQPGKSRSRPMTEVFDEFEPLMRPAIDAGITVEFDAGDPDLIVHCDPGQLENALLNLVINSQDAMRESGVGDLIRVSARSVTSKNPALLARQVAEGGDAPGELRFVEISVMDNGPGMTDDTRQRATDPFFTTRANTGGTGLGLAMVYGFAQQARGEMQIYSDLGRGTTVRIVLPRGSVEDQREAPQQSEDMPRGAGETVLLVEDEPALLEVMSHMLEDLGYRVIPAKNGPEALSLVRAGIGFDILLSDVVMPGGFDGIELAHKVHDTHPDRGIILMSGYVGPNTEPAVAVPFRVLQKPCMPGDLATALFEVGTRQEA